MTRLPAVPILLALASSASAATLQVPADFPAMAGALAVASSGDTVLVSPGTYLEHDLVLPSGVVLLGDAATPEHVVIDAAGQGRVLFGDDLAAISPNEGTCAYVLRMQTLASVERTGIEPATPSLQTMLGLRTRFSQTVDRSCFTLTSWVPLGFASERDSARLKWVDWALPG